MNHIDTGHVAISTASTSVKYERDIQHAKYFENSEKLV